MVGDASLLIALVQLVDAIPLPPTPPRRGRRAGELPKDELVIVIPEKDTQQRQTVSRIASLLWSHGQHVRVVEENGLTPLGFGEVLQETLAI